MITYSHHGWLIRPYMIVIVIVIAGGVILVGLMLGTIKVVVGGLVWRWQAMFRSRGNSQYRIEFHWTDRMNEAVVSTISLVHRQNGITSHVRYSNTTTTAEGIKRYLQSYIFYQLRLPLKDPFGKLELGRWSQFSFISCTLKKNSVPLTWGIPSKKQDLYTNTRPLINCFNLSLSDKDRNNSDKFFLLYTPE